jgi:multidrug efflux pump subunit AcrA (membrane-fusion protein)
MEIPLRCCLPCPKPVNIQARVSGFLDKRLYTKGAVVKEGQVLFQMDDKPYKAQLNQAKAVLVQQEAALETACLNLNSVKPLVEQNALSQKDLDEATGQYQSAAAAVEQARTQYETAATAIPQIEQQIIQTENALSILLGRYPSHIPRGKAINKILFPDIPAGITSDILSNRPDIRQAEQNLIAANAQIGAAKSLYFPLC